MSGSMTVIAAGMLAFVVGNVCAQGYPAKPLRLIVASSSGSGADIVARAVGQALGENLGQQVIVENRAGAGGNLGAEMAAKSPPDGYTLFLVTSTFSINVSLYPKLKYDLQRDFAPISLLLGNGCLVLITHPSFPARSVRELIAVAKSKPGQVNYASAGIGNSLHLAGELFRSRGGINIVHVPYTGSGPALTAVLGGEVPMAFMSLSALPHVRSNRLRALAVTSEQRSPSVPDIPTMMEAGVSGYTVTTWYGLLAPVKTPVEIINRLHGESVKVMQHPDMSKRFAADGLSARASNPSELAGFLKQEIDLWARVVREAKISIDD